MNILLINQDWFAPEFRDAGHRVLSYGYGPQFDLRQETLFVQAEDVLRRLPGDFKVDAVLVHDNSSPLTVVGLEYLSVPTIFNSVDAHHHHALHKFLAHLFDHTLIAQKDYLPEFQAVDRNPEWFPLWASRKVERSETKEHGAVFVGTLNPELNPDRVRFFEALKAEVPVTCMTGAWWDLFPKSKIVINQTVKGDLNFRVFEAMMCETLLLTEQSGNGLNELFTDGEHLVTYRKGDVQEAAGKIRALLNDEPRRAQIAARGCEEIQAKHLAWHRAQRIEGILSHLQVTRRPEKFFSSIANYSTLGRVLQKRDNKLSIFAYIHALRCAEEAMRAGEPLRFEIACHIIRCAHYYDQLEHGDSGARLVSALSEAYPQTAIFPFAKISSLVAGGEEEKARDLARAYSGDQADVLVQESQRVMAALLEG